MSVRKLVTFAAIAVAMALTARYMFWNDKRDIRRRLDTIAESAGAKTGETGPEREARAAQLGTFVTDDVIIRTDSSTFVGGRPAVVRFVLESAAAHGQIRFSLDDVQIERIDSSTDAVFLTLNISAENPHAPVPAPRQVHATFSKVRGEWLLSRGEVLRTLESPK